MPKENDLEPLTALLPALVCHPAPYHPGLASPPAGSVQPHAVPAKPASFPGTGRNALLVPSQYPTIQAAINASQDGDTVLVADGTYSGPGNRDIDFNGKNITVTSQNGPAKTIIDCGGYKSADGSGNHRGFYIHSGETNATISGFTVKNGYETAGINSHSEGGGINLHIRGGVFTLNNCIITGNTVASGGTADTISSAGGGIRNITTSGLSR